MNQKPIQRRFYKTAAARDAAIERVKEDNPDSISAAVEWAKYTDEQLAQRRARKPMTGPICCSYAIEVWKPFDLLRTMFPGSTDSEIVEAVRQNRDNIVIAMLEKRLAGSRGASATQSKGEKRREKIRKAFCEARKRHPDTKKAKKCWLIQFVVKPTLPKKRGYGERSIKTAVRDLK